MNSTTPGTKIKKLTTISILAIIAIVIMHVISWIPIINESDKIHDRWDDHKDNYSYSHNSSNCDKCEDYKEEISYCNQAGANLWQNTITNCVLIAIGGAIAYGVGILVDQAQQPRNYQ